MSCSQTHTLHRFMCACVCVCEGRKSLGPPKGFIRTTQSLSHSQYAGLTQSSRRMLRNAHWNCAHLASSGHGLFIHIPVALHKWCPGLRFVRCISTWLGLHLWCRCQCQPFSLSSLSPSSPRLHPVFMILLFGVYFYDGIILKMMIGLSIRGNNWLFSSIHNTRYDMGSNFQCRHSIVNIMLSVFFSFLPFLWYLFQFFDGSLSFWLASSG